MYYEIKPKEIESEVLVRQINVDQNPDNTVTVGGITFGVDVFVIGQCMSVGEQCSFTMKKIAKDRVIFLAI